MHVEEAKEMAVEEAKGLNQVVEDAKMCTQLKPKHLYFSVDVIKEDTERLRCALPKCEVLEFVNNGQFLFLEDGVDLATILKIAYYYRRGKKLDYIYDYTLPTPFELKEFEQSQSDSDC
ncbi:PREDICTED: acyltransferase-like protein At3g26840, chloroplastic isoform X3 [Brassica oleracea var. oleracea]|uniref:acyltransferase-like protein At3g26840, chloroplastic isoform X3 n=1 Tax=Brassica oleracea var. oleracea TaxID=109376 RepID=UPI0006A6DAFD|nr:PREDICTED: acyltransferase-like protein At3g26840, chloroplastic isoform X3 [Brassica oleracea var. oleracea]